MTVDHEASDPYEYDESDLEDLPAHQDLGNGLHEYNTSSSFDVLEILQDTVERGERIQITVFDEENGLAYDLFDRGITASYLEDEMNRIGLDIEHMIEYYSGGVIDSENIGFYQVHTSPDSTDLI